MLGESLAPPSAVAHVTGAVVVTRERPLKVRAVVVNAHGNGRCCDLAWEMGLAVGIALLLAVQL